MASRCSCTLVCWLLPVLSFGFFFPPFVAGQPFSFTTNTTSLSVSRAYLASTTVGSLALFAGGTTDGSDSSASAVVDIYNAANDSWTTTQLSQARAYLAATTVGSLALFAGGRLSNSSSSAVVDIYNAANDSWTTASLSQPRAWLAATSVGNFALFGGGLLTSSVSSASTLVDIYNAANNSWTTAQLWSPRSNLAATSVGSLAIFAFGRSDIGVAALSGAVDIYNATDNSWQNSSLYWVRHNLPAFTVGNLAFFPGGRSTGSFNLADFYNATDDAWYQSYFYQARDTSAAATVGNLGILAGGTIYGETTAYSDVDIYVSDNSSWIQTTPLTQSRWGLAGAAVGSVALFAGGLTNPTSTSSVVDIFNFTFSPSPSPSTSPSPSPSTSPSPCPSPSPSTSPSPCPSPIPDRVPTLQFNNGTGSDVLLIPKDNQGSLRQGEAVGMGFGGTLKERDASGSIVRVGSYSSGSGWISVEPGNGVNATYSFLFSATLAFSDDLDAVATNRTAAAEVQFYLFRERTAIAIGDNLTLHVEPSFAKFSVRLFDWPWRGGVNNTLEMRIKLAPAFTNFSRRANSGELVTSLTLAGQFNASSQAETEIRLVRVVEVDGEVDPQGARFDMDVAASELVLTFPRFNSTLVYDPDLGVLFLGGSRDSGSDTLPVAVIIGVSVAGAVAIMVVLAVVGGSIAATVWMRKRAAARVTSAVLVNFEYDDQAAPADCRRSRSPSTMPPLGLPATVTTGTASRGPGRRPQPIPISEFFEHGL